MLEFNSFNIRVNNNLFFYILYIIYHTEMLSALDRLAITN